MASDVMTRCQVEDVAAPVRNALVGGPFGSDLVLRDYVSSGVPVIRGTNMGLGRWVGGEHAYVTPEKADSLSANSARPGDIVFTQRGTLGQVALIPSDGAERYLISQSQMKLSVDEKKADSLFLYYVFTSREQQEYIQQNAIQTGVPHTNLGILRRAPLALPPLIEQKTIASVLGALDDKIELNRRMNATLEAMARALFQSWFVDFDPVCAKLDGRQPVGLDESIATLFPSTLQDSSIGLIPKEWTVKGLGEIASFDKGLSYKGDGLADEGGMPMVNLGCFTGRGLFNADRVKRYKGEYRDRHLVHGGDLVVANTDMTQHRIIIGSPAIVPKINGENRFLFTHHVFAVRFRPESEVWRRYVYFTLLKPEFRKIAEGFSTGTTVLALPRDGLENYLICLPPIPLLKAFERQVEPLLGAVNTNLSESRVLVTLRDTLLPKLLSGELRASRSMKQVEAAA